MNIYDYISREKPLADMLELLNMPGTSLFFETEEQVLKSLPIERHSVDRILDYISVFESVTALEILITRFWNKLSEKEKKIIRSKAYKQADAELVDKWFGNIN